MTFFVRAEGKVDYDLRPRSIIEVIIMDLPDSPGVGNKEGWFEKYGKATHPFRTVRFSTNK